MDVRSRRARQTSPDRAKLSQLQHHHHRHQQPPKLKPIKKVQVVYYVTRNGHLEHPHYMEVSHLTTQPLRLKDVMERLIALRGKGMPSLYSWSCKRSYKNGYVWNDLAENDIISPADGGEYVLKGSELLEGRSEKLQQLNVSSRQLIQEPKEPFKTTAYEDQDYEDEFEEDEEKTSFTSSRTSHSRCSRGVSTDELDEPEPEPEPQKPPLTESTPITRSPPSLSSILSREKPTNNNNNNMSKRFEDGDPVVRESAPSRNSVLLQLISCGNLAAPKAKTNNSNVVRRSSSDLHRGVLCKRAVKVAEEEEEKDMISFMSENPRFGNLQAEEKEYFSGSIVESVSKDRVETQPVLKKSNSYNEERSSKAAIMEETKVEEDEEEKRTSYGVKTKCIPRKKSSSSSSKKIIRK